MRSSRASQMMLFRPVRRFLTHIPPPGVLIGAFTRRNHRLLDDNYHHHIFDSPQHSYLCRVCHSPRAGLCLCMCGITAPSYPELMCYSQTLLSTLLGRKGLRNLMESHSSTRVRHPFHFPRSAPILRHSTGRYQRAYPRS